MKTLFLFLTAFFSINAVNAQWFNQVSGTSATLYAVYFTDSLRGQVVGASGTILNTRNGGKNWTFQASGTTQALRSVCFTDSLNGYAVGYGGTILHTSNGGNNWIQQISGTTEALISVCFTDSLNGYAVGSGGTILSTQNGGESWINQVSGTTYFLNSVSFPDSLIGYSIGDEGTILHTRNGGNTWNILKTGREWFPIRPRGVWYYLTSVCFTDSMNGYITGYGYAYQINAVYTLTDSFILKTTDGGISWSEVEFFESELQSVYFSDATTGYAVGNRGRIIKTTDGGISWSYETSGETGVLKSIFFTDPLTGYAVGDDGTILKTTNGGVLGIGENRNEHSINIYPNPVISQVTIVIPGYVKTNMIVILDIKGAEVIKQQTTGSITHINMHDLARGVYYVKLLNDRLSEVRKIIKL